MNRAFEILVGIALVAAFLIAIAQDAGAHRRHRAAPVPTTHFPLMSKPPGVYLGGVAFYQNVESFVALDNVDRIERDGPRTFRVALGPAAGLDILTDVKRVKIFFRFRNLVADQALTVSCNGETLERWEHLPAGEEVPRTFHVTLRPRSINRLRFEFSRYNHHQGDEPFPADPRPLAGSFLEMGVVLNE